MLTKELVKRSLSDKKKLQERVSCLRTRKKTISRKREWLTGPNAIERRSKMKTERAPSGYDKWGHR